MSGASGFMGRRAGTSVEAVTRLHRAILDLTAAGWSEPEIAKFVDRSGRHVRRVRSAEGWRRALERAAHVDRSADARIFSKLLRRA